MPDDWLLFVVTPPDSAAEAQLLRLFGLDRQLRLEFEPRRLFGETDVEVGFASRLVLDELGLDAGRFDAILEPLGPGFPPTRVLSEAARRSLSHVDPLADPDAALLAWMERQELLFRRLERRTVAARIAEGLRSQDGEDADGFIAFSLSVQRGGGR